MISGSDDPEERYRAMFECHFRPLVAVLMRRFRQLSREDAEDIAQEAFIRVFRSMDAPILNEWALLSVTATRLAINFVTRCPPPSLNIDNVPERTHPGPDAYSELRNAELRARIAGAISDLPAGTRECFLHRMNGLKYREIADLPGISMAA